MSDSNKYSSGLLRVPVEEAERAEIAALDDALVLHFGIVELLTLGGLLDGSLDWSFWSSALEDMSARILVLCQHVP